MLKAGYTPKQIAALKADAAQTNAKPSETPAPESVAPTKADALQAVRDVHAEIPGTDFSPERKQAAIDAAREAGATDAEVQKAIQGPNEVEQRIDAANTKQAQEARTFVDVNKGTSETSARSVSTPEPSGTGPFGPIYDGFRHDAQGAITHLMGVKDGEAIGALHHPEVGDIDLVWGKEGDPSRDYKGGYGLAKIAAKHPEVLNDLQGFLDGMHVEEKTPTWVLLESPSGKGVVRLDWNGETKHWLVSAYEKEAGGDRTSDTAAITRADDTAPRAAGLEPSGMPEGAARESRWPVHPAEGSVTSVPDAPVGGDRTNTDLGAASHGEAPEQQAIPESTLAREARRALDEANARLDDARQRKANSEPESAAWEHAVQDEYRAEKDVQRISQIMADSGIAHEAPEQARITGAAVPITEDVQLRSHRYRIVVEHGIWDKPGEYSYRVERYETYGGLTVPFRITEHQTPASVARRATEMVREAQERARVPERKPVEEVPESNLAPEDQALVQRTRARAAEARDNRLAESELERESRERGEREAGELGLRGAVVEALGPERMGKVHFVHDEDGLPEAVRRRGTPIQQGNVRYGLHTPDGHTYIFTKTANTPERAEWTAWHENGHEAIQRIVEQHPDVKVGSMTAKQAHQKAREIFLQNPVVKAIAEVIARQRKTRDLPRMAEEAMAELHAARQSGRWDEIQRKYGVAVPASMREGVGRAIDNFVRRIKAILNAVHARISGNDSKPFTDEDVYDLLTAMHEVGNGTREESGARTGSIEDQQVFHGSPHRDIEKEGFKLDKIGTGEGAQAYGWGMYFASKREVAQTYQPRNHDAEAEMLRHYNRAERSHDYESAELWEAAMLHKHPDDIRSDGAFEHLPQSKRDAVADELAAIYKRHQKGGQFYHAEIPEDHELLDWDKPLSEQPEGVREKLARAGIKMRWRVHDASGRDIGISYGATPQDAMTRWNALATAPGYGRQARPPRAAEAREIPGLSSGRHIYEAISQDHGDPRAASEYLRSIGIPGLRYLDGGSRGKGEGSHNYVIWDERHLNNDVTPYYSEEPAQQLRPARTFDDARAAAQSFIRKPLENDHGAVTATVSRTNLDKMLSESAARKSVNAEDHARAVANLDHLYKIGMVDHSHADRAGDRNITSIHRVVAPMLGRDGSVLAVKMTVKELSSERHNPLYSVEAIDVEKPALGAPHEAGLSGSPDLRRNSPQAGFNHDVTRMLEDFKRRHEGDEDLASEEPADRADTFGYGKDESATPEQKAELPPRAPGETQGQYHARVIRESRATLVDGIKAAAGLRTWTPEEKVNRSGFPGGSNL